jgi:membrane-associated phospholipid phosphatase
VSDPRLAPGGTPLTTTRRSARRRAAYLIAPMLLAAVVLALLTVVARQAAPIVLDVAVTHWLQGWRTPWLTPLMYAVSWPGYGPQAALLPLVVALPLALLGLRREALWAIGTLAVAVINAFVKLPIARPRPRADLVEVFFAMSDYSFPSGHTAQYTALFGFAFFLVYVLARRSAWRTALLVLAALPVVLIGPSRMYLGQHWLSDVLGGYALGMLFLVPYCWLYARSRLAAGDRVQQQVGQEPERGADGDGQDPGGQDPAGHVPAHPR